jgi:beta-barrel assembly-enhancing protease
LLSGIGFRQLTKILKSTTLNILFLIRVAMIKSKFLISAGILLSIISYGQDFNNYIPLKSSGTLPEDFTILSSKKYEHDKQTISKSDKLRDRKAKDEFYLESNYIIDDILLSGKVLFNDPVSDYVNKVADKLLAGNPDIRDKIRIYTLKSTAVNAFATNNGIIFVNLGLIAQLKDEAQLAYILSHELTHFTRKHVITEYVEKQNIKKGRGAYRDLSLEERYIAKNNYSKELESEADLVGLNIYLKSDYNPKSVLGVFDVLQFAYLPFEDEIFDKEFFENNDLVFPEEYFLEQTAPIKSDENDDDSKSTHPSTKKRRTAIEEQLINVKDEEKSEYLVGEEEFIKIRKLARYEMARLYVLNRKYEQAIYHAYLLMKKDPESKYLKVVLGQALYGLSKYYNHGEYNEVHTPFGDIEGQSQQVYHLLEKLDETELNVLAVQYLWNLRNEYPNDEEISLMLKDIFKEMVYKHYPEDSMFSSKKKEMVDDIIIVSSDSAEKPKNDFIKYSMISFLQDREFLEMFKGFSSAKKAGENKMESAREKKLRISKEQEAKSLLSRKGYALGLDKVVFVNPYYKRIDERKKNQVRYQVSEQVQLDFRNKLMANAKLLNFNAEVLNPNGMKENEIDKFNENSLLNEWIGDKLKHDDNINMISPIHNQVQDLIIKYGTSKFCWMGTISITDSRPYKGAVLFLTIYCFPALPYGIYYVATPRNKTLYYVLLYDIKNETLDMQSLNKIQQRDDSAILNSNIYYTIMQMKYKRKKR